MSLTALDDVPALALFLEVVTRGSLAGAARSRGLTTSAVSKRLAQLERRLGLRLLNRTTRRLALTDAGSQLQRHAERVLRQLEDAEHELLDLARAPRGVLRVASSVSFGQLHLGALAAQFTAQHRQVSIELALDEAFVDLVAGRFDVAIRCGRRDDSALVTRNLATSRRVVCAAPAYLARHGVPAHPRELADHACLRHVLDDAGQTWSFVEDRERIAVRVAGPVHANNPLLLRDAAVAGAGLARLPSFVVADDVRAGRLRAVLERFAIETDSVYALYPPGRQPSRLVRAFVDHLAVRLPDVLAR